MKISFERQVLPNGTRVLLAPMQETKAVTILMLVGAGSRYEDARTNGVAHFLEHMFFKGTTNRPSTLEISKELDTLGADYNAFTGEELTGFHVRVAGDDFLQAFDIITDMLLNPLFVDEEIEREKGVIVEELNMYEDTPMRSIFDQTKNLFYGDTPLGRNIGGKRESVKKFNRQDFLQFREKFYQPDNIIVAIAGAGDAKLWMDQIQQKLGSLQGHAETIFEPAKLATPERMRLVNKKTDQSHLVIGFPTFSQTDPQRPALSVLENILGGTMSSRLFIEVRERRGLAYYVRSGDYDFRDSGAIIARAGVQVEKIDEAIEVILDEYRRLVRALVGEEELERAKKNMRGSLYLGLEDSMAIAQYLASDELFWGRIIQPEEWVTKWNGVSREDIQELAKTYLQPEEARLAIIGPYDDQARFEKLLKR